MAARERVRESKSERERESGRRSIYAADVAARCPWKERRSEESAIASPHLC